MALTDFHTPRPDPREAKARIKDWVCLGAVRAGLLTAAADAVLLVTEINCPDPDCPGPETVVLLFRHAQETVEDAVKFKIKAPLSAVTEADVVAAMAALAPGLPPEIKP